MQIVPFLVENAADAVDQIRSRLGPDAVVLEVRQVEPSGLARLWKKPMLEVLACRPEPAAEPGQAPTAAKSAELELEQQLLLPGTNLEQRVTSASQIVESANLDPFQGFIENAPAEPDKSARGNRSAWRLESALESAGFQPLNAKRLVDMIQSRHGEMPPATLREEMELAAGVLRSFWRKPPAEKSIRPHVFVGAPGVGKTTAMCKWLTQAMLVDGRAPRVWRLDGATANTAEMLSIYCEVLGIPVGRSGPAKPTSLGGELSLIDLPGVDWRDPKALAELKARLDGMMAPHVHLVLNAAYDLPVLLAQIRAFQPLAAPSLVFTHLDEEPRWGKLWNFVLGTNCTVRFLSAGQNVPGGFHEATPELLLERLFRAKGA